MDMKKIGATTIVIIIIIPVVFAFGGHVLTKIDKHGEKLIFLETSRDYTKEDIEQIKNDIGTMKDNNDKILEILQKL